MQGTDTQRVLFGLWIVVLFLWGGACTHQQVWLTSERQDCTGVLRGAIDLGSGSTKVKAAKVNPCHQEIIEVIFEKQVKVPYREHLQQHNDVLRLSDEVQADGIEGLAIMVNALRAQGVEKIIGVATEVFRQAENGPQFVERVNQELSVQLKIISQKEEAQLAYRAAVLGYQPKQGSRPRAVVVWDIGGGSQQLSYQDLKGRWLIHQSGLGSVVFKNHIVSQIQGKSSGSPNPMTWNQVKDAKSYARSEFTRSLSSSWRALLHQPNVQVLGVGGVHRFSILGQISINALGGESSNSDFSVGQVGAALRQRFALADHEIQSEYLETEISNLVLVYALMHELGIQKITPVPVDLTEAILVQTDD